MVRRRWLRRALAFRSCVKANCATMISAYFREQRPPWAHKGDSHAVAVCTWHNVRSGFSPPMPQAEFDQEGMAHTTQNQMALNRKELAYFKVVHTQFRFAILKCSFNRPAGERHSQQRLDRGGFGGVADEIFDLLGIQCVSRDQQMMRTQGQAMFIRQINQHVFGLPDHRVTLKVSGTCFRASFWSERRLEVHFRGGSLYPIRTAPWGTAFDAIYNRCGLIGRHDIMHEFGPICRQGERSVREFKQRLGTLANGETRPGPIGGVFNQIGS